jgi:hypothetical protein
MLGSTEASAPGLLALQHRPTQNGWARHEAVAGRQPAGVHRDEPNNTSDNRLQCTGTCLQDFTSKRHSAGGLCFRSRLFLCEGSCCHWRLRVPIASKMSVRVVARIRPLLDKELGKDIIVYADGNDDTQQSNIVKIPNPKNESEEFSFAFNGVYDQDISQEQLFNAEGTPHPSRSYRRKLTVCSVSPPKSPLPRP